MRLGTVSVSVEAVGLRKYKSDLNKAGKQTDKFGNQSSKSVGKTSSAIKQLGLVAGSVLGAAVIGKLVKDSIVAFKNFETATVDMAKVTTRSLGEIRAEVLDMSSVLGTSICSNLIFIFLSNSVMRLPSLGFMKTIEIPFFPALPVLPLLWV